MRSATFPFGIAGLCLLLLQHDLVPVGGFLSWRQTTGKLTRRHATRVEKDTSPLPKLSLVSEDDDDRLRVDGRPSGTKNGQKARHRRKRKSDRREQSDLSIPENVPRLSDLLKDTTTKDFVVPAPNTACEHESSSSSKPWRRRSKSQQRDSLEQEVTSKPWRASYSVSTKTQERIKAAAVGRRNARQQSPVRRATAVLQTLLNTPPEQCNEANVVCALTISAKTMTPSSIMTDEFRTLLMKTLDVLLELVMEERLSARQLCNAVWAIAKHYNLDNSIIPSLPEAASVVSEEALGVAETWILQDSDQTPEQRVKDTVDLIAMQITRILQREQEEESQKRNIKVCEICMAAWAYGILRPRSRPPGWSIPRQIGHVPHRARRAQKPRNVEFVTFSTWAYAEEEDDLTFPADAIDRLFDAIGEALTREEPGEGANIATPLLRSCEWSEIANVAWAYAHHGYSRTHAAELVLQGLASEATRRLTLLDADGRRPHILPRDVAQLVWSIGTLQSDNFRLADDLVSLVDAIADHYELEEETMARPLQHWSCPDLVQLAISLAHGRIDHPALLRALYEEAWVRLSVKADEPFGSPDRRRSFFAWEVSVLLWAQARLYLRGPEGQVFDDFAAEAPSWLIDSLESKKCLETIGIGPQEQANLAWSLTVLEQYSAPAAERLLSLIFQEASSSSEELCSIQLEHAHQLWQALYLLEDDLPSVVELVPAWFRQYLQEKWNSEKARRKKSSARHRSLSQTLDLMGVAHYNEHDEDIDVAIVLKNESPWTSQASRSDHKSARLKIAVEFDGPNHFTREKLDEAGKLVPPRTLGHTVLKYRLLKKQGWTVVRVPYYEFDRIPFWASMERQRYLQRLLKTHDNIRFSKMDVSLHKPHVPNKSSRFD